MSKEKVANYIKDEADKINKSKNFQSVVKLKPKKYYVMVGKESIYFDTKEEAIKWGKKYSK